MSQLDLFDTTTPPVDSQPESEYRWPLELRVRYELHIEFRSMVEKEADCEIYKTIELLTCKMLLYIINCPKEKEKYITDLAFMTWIKNPKFQKYYKDYPSFKPIADQYLKEHTNRDYDNEGYTNIPDLEEMSRSDADPGL